MLWKTYEKKQPHNIVPDKSYFWKTANKGKKIILPFNMSYFLQKFRIFQESQGLIAELLCALLIVLIAVTESK